jgi:hypothetical protein
MVLMAFTLQHRHGSRRRGQRGEAYQPRASLLIGVTCASATRRPTAPAPTPRNSSRRQSSSGFELELHRIRPHPPADPLPDYPAAGTAVAHRDRLARLSPEPPDGNAAAVAAPRKQSVRAQGTNGTDDDRNRGRFVSNWPQNADEHWASAL